MNLLRRILLVPMTIIPFLSGASSEDLSFDFYSDYFYPFHPSESTYSQIKLCYRFTGHSSRTVYESFGMFNKNGIKAYSLNSNSHTLVYRKKYAATFNVDTTMNGGSNYYDMIFEVIDASTNERLDSISFSCRKQKRQSYAVENLTDGILQYSNAGIGINSYNENVVETFDFNSMNVFLGSDVYYTLNMSNQVLEYTYPLPYRQVESYLVFQDPANFFPYIFLRDENGNKKIFLTYEQNGNYVTFKPFTGFYYIDPTTYKMADYSLDGFVPCSNFYLPIGQRAKMEGMNMTLVIKGAGANRTNLTFETTFFAFYNLFGKCTTSEYCVSGGLSND